MNIRRFSVCALGLALICCTFAVAQEALKPGPEHERLGFWVGKWTNEGTIHENPMMPAGKFKGSETCQWFEGNFAVICHTKGNGPMGPGKGVGIMSYSPDKKAYTYYGTDSHGMTMTSVPLGTVKGNTWVYNDEGEAEGMTYKSRYTIKQTSDTSYTFKWEMQGPDGSWMTLMEGKGSKG